jgi:hypothetical protein
MAAPTYSAGSLGNVINAITVTKGANSAALVDLSTVLGGALLCKILTSSPVITAAVTFGCYRVTGATATGNTTLLAAASAGATTLSVRSASGIGKNTVIAVVKAAGLVGELVAVSNVSGTTLTVAATINAYSINDLVFLIEQTPSGGSVSPGSAWAASTEYSTTIYPPAAWLWIVAAKNNDASNSAAITVTLDKNPAFT